MFFRARRKIMRARLQAAFRDVLNTPPLVMTPAPIRIVSMLCARDVIPYLVAIKSFYRQLGHGHIVIVNDGTLTGSDEVALRHHLPGVTIRPITDGQVSGLPTGGTWERLCVIAEEAHENFVMQLDADTLCTGPLGVIKDLIDQNRPFALSDLDQPEIMTIGDYSAFRRPTHAGFDHIQDAAELALDRSGLPTERRYISATSAFAGFPKGSDLLPLLHEFHAAMSDALGEKWSEWGSEQVASNYAVANSGEAVALTAPGYQNHRPGADLTQASLVHFFGTHRFYRGHYRQAGQGVIDQMKGAA